jgi:prevent-host-death family protein
MTYQVPDEVASSEAREHFTDLVNAAAFQSRRVILNRSGRQMCAIIPIEDLHLLEKLEDSLDLREALEAIEDNKGEETISLEQVKEDLGI